MLVCIAVCPLMIPSDWTTALQNVAGGKIQADGSRTLYEKILAPFEVKTRSTFSAFHHGPLSIVIRDILLKDVNPSAAIKRELTLTDERDKKEMPLMVRLQTGTATGY